MMECDEKLCWRLPLQTKYTQVQMTEYSLHTRKVFAQGYKGYGFYIRFYVFCHIKTLSYVTKLQFLHMIVRLLSYIQSLNFK